MRRVLVIGCGGSGKSTFAKRLGEILHLPVVHLDSLYWKPGWVESGKAEWTAQVRNLISEGSWILDGNYSGTLAQRLEACDTVIFLDVPRITCLWRVIGRVARYHGTTRPDMPTGCPERLDLGFLLWIWNYPYRTRRKVMALLEAQRHAKKVIRLRTRTDVDAFLADTRAA